jgi:segregation and condensation protein A
LQYRAFKEVATWFNTALNLESSRIPRDVRMEERFKNQQPELVWSLTKEDFARLAEETMRPREIPMVGMTHLHASRVSIREQAGAVVELLRKKGSLTFFEVIREVKDRAVVVARFLAVLELYRMNALVFEQDTPLGDLLLTWRDNDFDDEKLATLGADYDS